MSTIRRFLVASSLARLIRKERGGNRVTEGYFPNQTDRSSYVHLEGDNGSLVLITTGSGLPVEERTEVPRAHAEALLDVTPGKVDYVRSTLSVGTRDVQVSRFVTPGPLDLILVEFEREEDARDFRPPSWFGPEVTTEQAYQNRLIALEGLPQIPEIPLSNGDLNGLLDVLENRYGSARSFPPAQPDRAGETGGLRQRSPSEDDLTTSQQSAPSTEPMTAVEIEATNDERDNLNLNIEDNVIRELARSLRPQRK